jgi:NAD(P)-dependent dehydrogenase (short-subunit alcohol dehydrogenase family)
MRLEGKVALITGASRGNGRAIAIGFAQEGAHVAVNYRKHQGEALSAVEKICSVGRRAIAVQADVSSSAEVKVMVDQVTQEFGRIDVLVNNAGVLNRTPFLELTEAEWDWVLDTNLKGYFLVGQAVAREMVKQRSGVIINMSSAGQQLAAPNLTHYNTAKGGIAQLTRQMAYELVGHGIRVNAICPGLIETDMNRRDLAQPEFRNFRLAGIPMKAIGTPEDLVGTAIYLACDDSRLVTGTHLFVDAGQSMI